MISVEPSSAKIFAHGTQNSITLKGVFHSNFSASAFKYVSQSQISGCLFRRKTAIDLAMLEIHNTNHLNSANEQEEVRDILNRYKSVR